MKKFVSVVVPVLAYFLAVAQLLSLPLNNLSSLLKREVEMMRPMLPRKIDPDTTLVSLKEEQGTTLTYGYEVAGTK